jgi:hypothetical protein
MVEGQIAILRSTVFATVSAPRTMVTASSVRNYDISCTSKQRLHLFVQPPPNPLKRQFR